MQKGGLRSTVQARPRRAPLLRFSNRERGPRCPLGPDSSPLTRPRPVVWDTSANSNCLLNRGNMSECRIHPLRVVRVSRFITDQLRVQYEYSTVHVILMNCIYCTIGNSRLVCKSVFSLHEETTCRRASQILYSTHFISN